MINRFTRNTEGRDQSRIKKKKRYTVVTRILHPTVLQLFYIVLATDLRRTSHVIKHYNSIRLPYCLPLRYLLTYLLHGAVSFLRS